MLLLKYLFIYELLICWDKDNCDFGMSFFMFECVVRMIDIVWSSKFRFKNFFDFLESFNFFRCFVSCVLNFCSVEFWYGCIFL